MRRRFQLLWECQNWSILFFTLGWHLRYTSITPVFILVEESLYSPLSPWLLSYQLARLSTRDGPMVNHTLHLSNTLSVAFSEEDPRSFTNVLRLLHELETNLCSLTSPQRVLVKQKRNNKQFSDWVSCGTKSLFPTSKTRGRMDTSLPKDFWDRLVRTSVTYDWWMVFKATINQS